MIGLFFLFIIVMPFTAINARMGIFEITTTEQWHFKILNELATDLQWDFWKPPLIGVPVKFTADSDGDNIRQMKGHLQQLNLTLRIVNGNLDQIINNEFKESAVQRMRTLFRTGSGGGIETYFSSHRECNEWLRSLEANNRDLVTLRNIGKSYEKRDMVVIKLSTGPGKKAMFLDGGIHAREWLAVSSVIWILNKMVNGHQHDDHIVKKVLDKFDIYLLPITNPDGYERSRLGGISRAWRKNTMPVGNGCFGLDLNRNFDSEFGRVGVNFHPCSPIYPGKKPFSAPETVNFRDFIMSIKSELKLFITFHAYSQLLLTPWAYTKTPPSDNEEMMRVANIMAKAIYQSSGIRYRVGSPANILYAASGGSYDWVKQIGVKYSYAFEVRPGYDDEIGFYAPIKWIKPTGEELYDAVIAAARAVK